MSNNHQAILNGHVLTRGAPLASLTHGGYLTFAYVTDAGDIATQESGAAVVITAPSDFKGLTVRKAVRTVDCTPTWRGILPMLLLAYADGNANGRKIAFEELGRMADIADDAVAASKAAKTANVEPDIASAVIGAAALPATRTLPNGGVVLDARDLPEKPGNMAAEILLCSLPDNRATPWATWQSNKADSGLYWGHYFDNEADARADFESRGGPRSIGELLAADESAVSTAARSRAHPLHPDNRKAAR